MSSRATKGITVSGTFSAPLAFWNIAVSRLLAAGWLATRQHAADNQAMNVRRLLWNALAVWGAACADAILALVGVFANRQIPKTDTATRKDVYASFQV